MTDEPLDFEISVHQVKSLLDQGESFFLLDCREQNEYDTVHLEQATLIPMSELQQRVSELDGKQAERIVVHCHLGGRSQRVAMWLRQQGYQNAQNMTGGIDAWSLEIDSTKPRY